MSLSSIVDLRYRLQPADIGQRVLRLTINNISVQGVEDLRPVLHFAEFPTKRLVLDSDQRRALIQMTGSVLFADWVGHQVDLSTGMGSVVHDDQGEIAQEQPVIVLGAPGQVKAGRRANVGSVSTSGRWTSWLLLFVILLAFAAAYLLENSDALWQLLEGYFR